MWVIFNNNNNHFIFHQTMKGKPEKKKAVKQLYRSLAPYSGRRGRLLFHTFLHKHNGIDRLLFIEVTKFIYAKRIKMQIVTNKAV